MQDFYTSKTSGHLYHHQTDNSMCKSDVERNNNNISSSNNNINNNNNNNNSNNNNNINNNIADEANPQPSSKSDSPCVLFERSPSMYFLIERDTMLLFRLAGLKLKPPQQERLYWNMLHLLNSLENEEEMKTCHAREDKPRIRDTFDGGGYGIFWDEYRSIEQSKPATTTPVPLDSEDGSPNKEDKRESEIQWLNDVGFTNIAKKIRARHEIDQNDDDMKIIAASLTRAQANAVRRRIDSLNEAIRQRKLNEKATPSSHVTNTTTSTRRHVKDIFTPHNVPTGTPNTNAKDDAHKRFGTKKRSVNLAQDVKNKEVSWVKQDDTDLTSKDLSRERKKSPDLGRTRSMMQQRPSVLPKPEALPRQLSFGSSPSANSSKIVRSSKVSTQHPDVQQQHFTPVVNNAKQKSPSINTPPSVTPTSATPPYLQLDNLVRRTSESNLITGEASFDSRPKSAGVPRSNTAADQFNFNELDLRASISTEDVSTVNNITRDNSSKRLESSSTTSPRDSISMHDSELRKSKSLVTSDYRLNTDLRSPTHDVPNSQQKKRLVVVDSTYINVGTVEDSYTTVNRENKPFAKSNSRKSYNHDDSSSSASSNTIYHDDSVSLKPYDLSTIETTLPQDLSASSSSLPRDETFHSESTENGSHMHDSVPDGNAMTTAKSRSKHSSESSEHSSKGRTHERKKEKRKHKSSGHKSKHKHPSESSNENHSTLQNKSSDEQHLQKPAVNNGNISAVVNSYTPSNSDDNRSIESLGSVGSVDDLQLPGLNNNSSNNNNKDFQVLKSLKSSSHLYETNTDSSCTTPNKSFQEGVGSSSDISMSPRTQSPQYLEGDAKLKVGSVSLTRDTGRSSPDPLQEPNFPKLPNFTLTKEDLGMTHVGDLSETDMTRIRSLALIELTALFEAHSIPIKRRKPTTKRFKENGSFGVALTTMCSREESKYNPDVKVPLIFRKMIHYLEKNGLHEEGILRIPGSTPRVKAFREEADKHPDMSTVTFEGKKMTDIATCLKQFLRDLPVPLLSYEYQNTFTSVSDLPDRKVQLQALNLLVLLLHPVHQETLKVLLVFLSKIVGNESHNKMGLNNVAMIMAPNLFFHNNAKISVTEAIKAFGMTDVLRMLIKYQRILWTIPAFMVRQIRFLYDAGAKTKDPKALSKLIRKKKVDAPSPSLGISVRTTRPSSSGEELEDFDENLIIRVKAPNLNKQSMAIQLSTNTTVAEVIAKFQWQRQKSNKEKDEIDSERLHINLKSMAEGKHLNPAGNVEFFLYEVGGNISERRLEGTAYISAILKENPNAEWVLKSEIVQ